MKTEEKRMTSEQFEELLPEPFRDFHDQKDLFKAIQQHYVGPEGKEAPNNWMDNHVYVIDYFLWHMARHGYRRMVYRLRVSGRGTKEIAYGLLPTLTTFQTRENWTIEQIREKQKEVKEATKAKGIHQTGNGFGLNLSQALRLFPALTHRDYRSQHAPNSKAFLNRMNHPRGVALVEFMQRQGHIGKLNPTWCEWFMGYPIGWTELKPSETPLSRKSRTKSSKP